MSKSNVRREVRDRSHNMGLVDGIKDSILSSVEVTGEFWAWEQAQLSMVNRRESSREEKTVEETEFSNFFLLALV